MAQQQNAFDNGKTGRVAAASSRGVISPGRMTKKNEAGQEAKVRAFTLRGSIPVGTRGHQGGRPANRSRASVPKWPERGRHQPLCESPQENRIGSPPPTAHSTQRVQKLTIGSNQLLIRSQLSFYVLNNSA